MQTHPRKAGVMLPVASLPSRHGIGDLGQPARDFIDMLADCRVHYWQILPMNPLGFGNSPYQPYSSFAGDPIFISLDMLHEEGLLPAPPEPFAPDSESIDYEAVRVYKNKVLREAFEAFTPGAAYEAFVAMPWVHPYAVYATLKRKNHILSWVDWPEEEKNWPITQSLDLTPHEETIRYEMFLQYLFYTQWMLLKDYANQNGLEIIGDIPIYVGFDSQDVWTSRENFLLDENDRPTFVAGVPPDYFSETGQRWGNPLYNWEHIQNDGFTFWVERLRYCQRLYDVIRIDHFRAFDTYWKIPVSCPTAVEGTWELAPGYALFDAIFAHMPNIQIIAEDLGMLRDEVYALRDHYHFRGMKILQFTFDPKHIDPAGDAPHMVIYTGTHDNQTMFGWYLSQPLGMRLKSRWALWRAGYRGTIAQQFLQLALDDAADIAIIPAADVIGLNDTARINTPGTVGSPNWEWKLANFDQLQKHLRFFAQAVVRGKRGR